MDEEEGEGELCAPVRPYSAETDAAGGQRRREGRRFRPTPPTERRGVERGLLSSAPPEETVQSLLREASRRQDLGDAPQEAARPERFQGMALRKFGLGAGAAAQAAALASRVGGSAAPRRLKELKTDRSMELMDLAFRGERRTVDGQMRPTYAPISLPYYNVTEEEEAQGAGEGSGGRKSRPALTHVDEANANAARELFLDEKKGGLREEAYVLMQLPCVLPELLDPLEEVQREQEDAASAGAGAGITRLPDGLLGKLRIHKSGKVRMELGGLPFCADEGSATFFQQDLACVCPLANEVIDLGPIHKRVVLTPDVDAMLEELVEAAQRETAPCP